MISTTQLLISVPSVNGVPLISKQDAETAVLRASDVPVYHLGTVEKQHPELIEDLIGKVIFI